MCQKRQKYYLWTLSRLYKEEQLAIRIESPINHDMWHVTALLLLTPGEEQGAKIECRYIFRRCSGQIHSFQSAPENRATILGCLLVLQIYQQKRSQEESRVKYFNSPFSSRKTLDNLLSFRFSAAAPVCFLPFPVISYLLRIRFQLTKV